MNQQTRNMSNNKWPEATMMIHSSSWGETPTFKMIPVSNDCPYVECIYNPAVDALVVIGKTKKEQMHLVPKLDEQGDPMKKKGAKDVKDVKQKSIMQESYSEYYLTNVKDIKEFIHKVGVNALTSEFEKVMDRPKMESPRADGLLTGPTNEGLNQPLIIS